jgi:hypothetical protein
VKKVCETKPAEAKRMDNYSVLAELGIHQEEDEPPDTGMESCQDLPEAVPEGDVAMEEVPWDRPWIPVVRDKMKFDIRQRLQAGSTVEMVIFSEEELFFSTDVEVLVQRGLQRLIVLVPDMPEARIWSDLQKACVRRYFYSRHVQLFEQPWRRDYWALLLDWSPEGMRKAQVDGTRWMELDNEGIPRWGTAASRRRDRRSRK